MSIQRMCKQSYQERKQGKSKKTLIILGVLIACYLDRNLQASPRKLLTPLKIKNYHK
ncbi:hypothetical protein B603_0082 [Chlamydia psittaci WC]|nr:hypothetical protein B603_0082 [Chlamydia psittaci WC]